MEQTFEDAVNAFFAAEVPVVDAIEKPKPKRCSNKNKDAPKKMLSCDDCSKTFRYRSSLKEHQLSHKGEMPFQCPHPGCTFRFKWRSSLSNHRRYHKVEQGSCPAPETKRGRARTLLPRSAVKVEAEEAIGIFEADVAKPLSDPWKEISTAGYWASSDASDTRSDLNVELLL